MTLHILSPEGTLVKADVTLVTLPGLLAPFTVLPGHAAIVTALEGGVIRYVEDGAEKRLAIKEGFASVEKDVITACVEL